jgi:hypothetical protein
VTALPTSDPLTVEETDHSFAFGVLSSTCEYMYNCNVCGIEYQHEVDQLSEEDEMLVSHSMFRKGWRNVSWPQHTGIACPECIKRGTIEY